ncbi:MAG: hypothetical protein JWO38_6680 [Gemmataceae bacterium]|nr:hypothetical protein [Gemmataceae bacterium]
MRKGILGSIAGLAAGAGGAWGQSPLPPVPAGDPPPPAAVGPAGEVIQANGALLPPGIGQPVPPAPVIMPPLSFGPPGDPQGLGPVSGLGPPPGPMYPNPGPYGAPMFQPAPPAPTGSGGYGGAPHWWATFDYLLFFSRAQPVHFPLLTTSAPVDQGIPGRASTLVLVGNKHLSYNPFSGGRVTAGFYGDADRRYGFEASGFLTETKSNVTDIASSPSGIPTLARPFLDSATPRAFSTLLAANPGFGSGRVVLGTSSRAWGVEGDGLLNLYRSEPGCKCTWSLDLIGGYRYFELDEDLGIRSSTTLGLPATTTPIFATGPFGILTQVGTTTTPGTTTFGGLTVQTPATILVQDMFKVTNRFNGGQLGLRTEIRYGMFTVTATGKFAIGDMNERLEITGASAVGDMTRNQFGTAFGGLYANARNIGRFSHDEFTFIPEANLNLGMNISRGLTAFLGYNFIYVDKVARPADQINPIVNSATVPFSPNYGAAGRPATLSQLFVQDSYWLMGINFGMMLRY